MQYENFLFYWKQFINIFFIFVMFLSSIKKNVYTPFTIIQEPIKLQRRNYMHQKGEIFIFLMNTICTLQLRQFLFYCIQYINLHEMQHCSLQSMGQGRYAPPLRIFANQVFQLGYGIQKQLQLFLQNNFSAFLAQGSKIY